jgi:hypothetical protein
MNDFFNAPDAPTDFTRADADQLKAIFAQIAAGFDLLPARDALLEGRTNYAAAAGTANALTLALPVPPESYVEGAQVTIKASATNTNAATINVNGLGVKNILTSAGAALVGGEIASGAIYTLTYDGAAFRMPAQGPQGIQGIQGPQGASGGLTLLNGARDPIAGDGGNGDFWINTAAWKVFGPKAAGAWPAGVNMLGTNGANGANGANGTNGNTVLNGAGAPAGGTGVNGDFYINTTPVPWLIYGPKAGGAWPAGVPIGTTANLALTGTNTVNGNEIGFRDLPKSRTVSANFTLATTDRGCFIEYNDTGDICTVPANATVAIPVGAVIAILNDGTGNLAINREAGVAMKLVGSGVDANRTLAPGGYAWLHKANTNTWYISGQAT